MAMSKGEPDSQGFFPEQPERRVLARPGEVRGFKYPDTEDAILRDQTQFVKSTTAALPKPDFRH
jgi:hypothetical protein